MTVRKYSEDELKIIDTVDIVEVVEQFVSLSKHGNSYTGFSPFKSEKTPSFSVKPSDKIFKDFSTGIGGNVISFYARMKNISYREAMQELSGIYGIRLSNTTNKFVNKETIYHKILKDANDIFRRNLLENQRALEYMQSRGYSLENLKKYNIGYAKDGWNLLLSELSEKYTVEDIYKSGLITMNNENTNYFDSFRDRIMFPIYNVRNQIIAFGGRYIGSDSESPKYINSVETEIFKKSNELYGIFDMGTALKNNKYAILTEGYLDVLKTHINGFETAVASLGTAFTENQAKLLKRYVDSIIILYDNDEAGQNATKKVINILNNLEFNIKCLRLPEGIKDPDEYFNKYNSNEFTELLKHSVSPLDYLFDVDLKNLNLNESSAKRDAIKRMKTYFENISNHIVYKDDLVRFSKYINVDLDYLEKEYYVTKITSRKKVELSNVEIEKKYIHDIRKDLEKRKIEALIYSNEVTQEYRDLIVELEILDPIYKELDKKLNSIDYSIEKLKNIYLTEEEDEILLDVVTDKEPELKKLTEEKAIKLFKDWLTFYIDEMIKQTENFAEIEVINKKFRNTQLKNKLNNSNSIMKLREVYNEINELRGD